MKKIKRNYIILTLIMSIFLISCNNNETTQPKSQDLIDAVFASGYITTDHEYLATANTEGFLLRALVQEGDSVRQGDQLFVISNNVQSEQLQNAMANFKHAKARLAPDSPDIQQSRLKWEQAQLQFESDEKNFHRHQQLVKTGAVSQVEFDRIFVQYQNAKWNLDIAQQSHDELTTTLQLNLDNASTQLAVERERNGDYVMTSAVDGLVISVYEQEGALVRKGSPVAKISGGAYLVKLYVAEEDINLLASGQLALIALNTDVKNVYSAEISRILPAFDEQEQSYVAEARFLKRPPKLFSNTQLQANIIIEEKKDVITVPSEFLLEGDSVLLSDKKKVAVEVGIRSMDWVEIVRGISSDQILILPRSEEL